MKRFAVLVIMGVVILSHPVRAEMYRYKDAGGVIRFTDNLADVPEKQRAGMSVYESTSSPSATEQPSGQNQQVPEKPKSVDSTAGVPQTAEFSNDPSRVDKLLKIKTALDEENAQFMKESLALSEEKKTLSGNDAIKAYNEKVNALNARVDDYEKRRAVFQKEADAFDAGLKKQLAPLPQPSKSLSP
jgi:hypothetical protein